MRIFDLTEEKLIQIGRWIAVAGLVALAAAVTAHELQPAEKPPVFKEKLPLAIRRQVARMTLEERIGQLIVYKPAYHGATTEDSILRAIARDHAGGLLLSGLPLRRFLQLTDSARRLSDYPLLIGTEEKVSLHNQFSDLPDLPLPATVAAIRADSVREELIRLYTEQCTQLGINFSLASTVREVLPGDTIFNYQCFESDQRNLLRRALEFVTRLQRNGILAFADGFAAVKAPEADTFALSPEALWKYTTLTRWQAAGITLNEPAYGEDTTQENTEAHATRRFLRNRLGFYGLVVAQVDSLSQVGQLLAADTDLFITDQPDKVFQRLLTAVREGKLTEEMLAEKTGRVLIAKNWTDTDTDVLAEAGQEKVAQMQAFPSAWPQVSKVSNEALRDTAHYRAIEAYFKDPYWQLINRRLYESSLIVTENPDAILPLQSAPLEVIHAGPDSMTAFDNTLDHYTLFKSQRLIPDTAGLLPSIRPLVGRDTGTVVITVNQVDLNKSCHGLFYESINELARRRRVVVVNFGSPLNLTYWDSLSAQVQLFESNPLTQSLAAQLIMGAQAPEGRLPVEVSQRLPFDRALTFSASRIQLAPPSSVGIDSAQLARIDQIAREAIRMRATPGCQVAVVKSGKLIYSKAFGYHTYKKERPVLKTDLYDIASVTKAAATTLGIMYLYERDSLSLKTRIGNLIEGGNPRTYTGSQPLYNLLTHHTMLPPNLPVLPYVYVNFGKRCGPFYCPDSLPPYTLPVAENIYFNSDLLDNIFRATSRMGPFPDSIAKGYSDIHFYLLQHALERKTGMRIDSFLQRQFYGPLQLRRTLYRPYQHFAKEELVPTAFDRQWRRQLVHGYVHDEQAAILGGIAGHAGIFSTAEELAVIFQMLLNGGTYGGHQFFKPETVAYFAGNAPGQTVGLGFSKSRGNLAPSASLATYGHTGFTGTCVFVDPEHELVYIFLSNRVHPDAANQRLQQLRTRERIHQVIYESLGTFKVPEWAAEDLEV